MGDFTNFPARCHGPVPHECETAMTGNPLISPENGYCVVSSTFSDDASSWALFGSVSGCRWSKMGADFSHRSVRSSRPSDSPGTRSKWRRLRVSNTPTRTARWRAGAACPALGPR